jgi:hypothetical protein
MEENIKVVTLCSYHDKELDKILPKNKIRWLTQERARKLIKKNLVKLLEIRKCVYEPRTTNTKNAIRNPKRH